VVWERLKTRPIFSSLLSLQTAQNGQEKKGVRPDAHADRDANVSPSFRLDAERRIWYATASDYFDVRSKHYFNAQRYRRLLSVYEQGTQDFPLTKAGSFWATMYFTGNPLPKQGQYFSTRAR